MGWNVASFSNAVEMDSKFSDSWMQLSTFNHHVADIVATFTEINWIQIDINRNWIQLAHVGF